MEPFETRCLSAVVLLALTFVVGFVPPFLFQYFESRKRKRRAAARQQRNNRRSLVNGSNKLSVTFNNEKHSNADAVSQPSCNGDNLSDNSTEHVLKRRASISSIDSISSIASKAGFNSAKLLQAFMFFGGGVLLATCFCHLIPEARENFNSYMKKHGGPIESTAPSTAIPLSHHDHLHEADDGHVEANELHPNGSRVLYEVPDEAPHSHSAADATDQLSHELPEPSHSHDHGGGGKGGHAHGPPYIEIGICVGFFLIYLLEEAVHSLIGHHEHKHETEKNKKRPSTSTLSTVENANSVSANNFNSSIIKRQQMNPSPPSPPSPGLPTPATSFTCSERHIEKAPFYDNYAVDLQSEPQLNTNGYPSPLSNRITADPTLLPNGSLCSLSAVSQESTSSSKNSSTQLPASVRFLRGFVIIVAFSAHSIFDGITVAAQNTTSQIFTMLFAILLHKLVVAFAVGLQLFDETASLTFTAVHMFLFSAMSPLGVLIVMFAQGSDVGNEDSSLTLIMLSAVATGTILYIVFFEILKRDEKNSLNGFVLWLVMLVGFLLMLSVTVFIDH